MGFPLRPLNSAYHQMVTKDVAINAGSFLVSWSPLSHLEYWLDNDVIEPIATSLAEAWEKIN